MDKCFRDEKERKRRANFLKSKEFDKKFQQFEKETSTNKAMTSPKS